MDLNILLGILLIATGAFSAGSFAVPFGKIKGWKWESYWMVYSLGAYILMPSLGCLILAPGFIEIIGSVPKGKLLLVFILGAIYGIGNLSFGLSLRYLGLSLGYALSLGLMLVIGTLVPPVIAHTCSRIIHNRDQR
jgi:L-rhamnose-H+ transport protein